MVATRALVMSSPAQQRDLTQSPSAVHTSVCFALSRGKIELMHASFATEERVLTESGARVGRTMRAQGLDQVRLGGRRERLHALEQGRLLRSNPRACHLKMIIIIKPIQLSQITTCSSHAKTSTVP